MAYIIAFCVVDLLNCFNFFKNIRTFCCNATYHYKISNYLNGVVMNTMSNNAADLILICSAGYILLAASAAKIGSGKESGTAKVFLCSIFLTPLIGFGYALSSPKKNVLKIVHYRCPSCGLEHTSKHDYCPTCRKDGKRRRLIKICMQTY
jgi:hypothetical protein